MVHGSNKILRNLEVQNHNTGKMDSRLSNSLKFMERITLSWIGEKCHVFIIDSSTRS